MDGWLYLVSQGGQVSLEALVFALQGLHAGQVVAVVVGVEGLVLLLDPLLGLISIPAAAQFLQLLSFKLCSGGGCCHQEEKRLRAWRGRSLCSWCLLPVEPLHLVGTAQHVAPLLSQLLQRAPALVQLLHTQHNYDLLLQLHNIITDLHFH